LFWRKIFSEKTIEMNNAALYMLTAFGIYLTECDFNQIP
jgi:hypothetical protein